MSPTLLELFVAVLLLWTAWQIGVIIAPRILAAFFRFWRGPRAPLRPNGGRFPEKNITPPAASEHPPSSTHGHPGR